MTIQEFYDDLAKRQAQQPGKIYYFDYVEFNLFFIFKLHHQNQLHHQMNI